MTHIIHQKKSHLLISPPISTEKSWHIENMFSRGEWIYTFKNSNFCLKMKILSMLNIVSCLPWHDRITPFIFLFFNKLSAKYLSLSNHSLSLVFSSKNGVLWKKQPIQFPIQSQKCFLFKTIFILLHTAVVLYVYFIT